MSRPRPLASLVRPRSRVLARRLAVGVLGIVAAGSGASAATVVEQDAPPARTAAADTVEAALGRLEEAHRDVDSFVSPVVHHKEFGLEGDREVRSGRVVVVGQGTGRRVAIDFTMFIDPAGHRDDSRTHWVYADGWLTELDHGRRRFVERQVLEPGERRDPLRVGEGPFPLPLGQRAADVLARFDVTFGEMPDVPMFRVLAAPDAPPLVLNLVPKPGTPTAEDTAEAILIFDRDSLLPVGLVVESVSGDRTIVRLRGGEANRPLTAEERGLLAFERPAPDSGWRIERKPLAGLGEDGARP